MEITVPIIVFYLKTHPILLIQNGDCIGHIYSLPVGSFLGSETLPTSALERECKARVEGICFYCMFVSTMITEQPIFIPAVSDPLEAAPNPDFHFFRIDKTRSFPCLSEV